MSIKPIDFQVQIPKTTEIARTSSEDAQKNLSFQQQQATLTQQLAEGSMKKVYSHDKAHNTEIREKQKDNGQQQNKKGKNGENEEKDKSGESKNLNDHFKTSTIDIKI